MTKYKYVRVAVKSRKKKTTSKPKNQDFGLFSSSDLGSGFAGAGSFDFGGSYGGQQKQVSIKQQYLKEKQDFDYSKKYRALKQEKRKAMFEDMKNNVDNVKRGAENVKRGAERVGSGLSSLFKRKSTARPKSIYKKKWGE